ncbi:hypothetical protein Pmani_028790 [Petrolisthes manimaculis]|uniref:Carbohydrate sulfotransferase n=1 Tax=Petrolisthes manimaculis TaxID=1843537 RepID=A0AAE1NZC9_9EUCA|nr:hypothetical protein Pmani_028790 [Petrolisthes manimaculis]
MLLVVLFLTHNIGHNIMKNPLHHTEREVQPQANSSETPLDENRLEQGYHDEDESEIGRTMKERRERIKSVCKKYQPYNNVRNTLTFRDYYFHNFDITVCLIAKRTAGASWQQLIYSFWVPVLHTNHMLPPDFHQRLGLEKPFDPKIMYDVHVYQKLRAILMPKISFAQFIRHVVATFEINKADAHWKDYTSECSPCYFDYQYVTKLEYMTQELDYVFKKFGIPSDPEFAYNTKRSTLTDFTSDYE